MKIAPDAFVLVSEDAQLIATVRAAVGAQGTLHTVANVAAALELARGASTVGVIVDGQIVRGQPAQELARLRAQGPLVRLLFIATELAPTLLNDLQPLRVELLARPLPAQAFERFVGRTRAAGRLSDVHVGAWIEHLASAHKLNGTDVALFPVVLDRETPDQLCARLNMDRAALSRGLRRLVKKCRVRNTDRLAKNLMRDALLFGAGAMPQVYASDLSA